MATNRDGPSPLDCEVAARRAVLSETIQHPLTLIPALAGGVAGIGLGIFALVSAPIATVIATAGFLIGGGNFLLRFHGEGAYKQQYAKLHEEFENIRKNKLTGLASELRKLKCKKGETQVRQLDEKFQNLVQVFDRVLNPGELTHSRFIGVAEQGYRAALNNLERIVALCLNTDDIDHEDVRQRIVEFEGLKTRRAAQDRELLALRKQIGVYDSARQEVEDLLAANEEALAAMDQAGAAAVRIKDSSASQTPAESLKESLEHLGQMVAWANKTGPTMKLDLGKQET